MGDKPTRIDPDELAALTEQRSFLLASLDDLDREFSVGDLDEGDYGTLHADYTARAAQVLREIEDTELILKAAAPTHRGWRRVIIVAAVVVVAVVAAVVVTTTSGSNDQRTAEDTGTLTPSKATQACIDKMQTTFMPATDGQAESNFGSDAVATIRCFTERIAADPGDAVAYTYRGRTLALLAQQLGEVASVADVSNFSKRAASDLAEARKLAPHYPDALAFSAIDALSRGDTTEARHWLDEIDRLQLPANNPVLPIVNNVLRPALRATSAPSTTAGTSTTPSSTVTVTPTITSAPSQPE